MPTINRQRRGEVLLLPECLDDFIDSDNPVRALDQYIDSLDLPKLGFHIKAEGSTGRPVEYEPEALLKLLAYGYLNQIRSSRKLEKQTRINLEVIWLVERARPDHWTINEFRRKNADAFKQVLRDFHKVCDVLELFGKELLAGDGSFFKALNNKAGNFTQDKLKRIEARIDAAIDAYGEALDAEEAEESGSDEPAVEVKNLKAEGDLPELSAKKKKIESLRKQAKTSESGQVSFNDPESRLLRKGDEKVVGHNVQCSVDGKNTLIAHIGIAQAGNDTNQLEPLARESCEALGIEPEEARPIDFTADGGYLNHGHFHRLAENHIQVHVPAKAPSSKPKPGFETEIDFHHDAATDEYICPQGERLQRHADTKSKGITYETYYSTRACRGCPVREQCTEGAYRKIKISQYREAEKAVAANLKERPEVYARRKELAELPFGTMKSIWGYRQFMVTGTKGCEGELNLMAFCFNWKRVVNLVGVERLMEAIEELSGRFFSRLAPACTQRA